MTAPPPSRQLFTCTTTSWDLPLCPSGSAEYRIARESPAIPAGISVLGTRKRQTFWRLGRDAYGPARRLAWKLRD